MAFVDAAPATSSIWANCCEHLSPSTITRVGRICRWARSQAPAGPVLRVVGILRGCGPVSSLKPKLLTVAAGGGVGVDSRTVTRPRNAAVGAPNIAKWCATTATADTGFFDGTRSLVPLLQRTAFPSARLWNEPAASRQPGQPRTILGPPLAER